MGSSTATFYRTLVRRPVSGALGLAAQNLTVELCSDLAGWLGQGSAQVGVRLRPSGEPERQIATAKGASMMVGWGATRARGSNGWAGVQA